MSNILKQRHGLTKRYFEITDNSLKISVTKPFKYFEEELEFEEIGKKTFKNKSYNRFVITGAVICFVGLVVTIGGTLGGDKTISFGDILFYVFLSALVGVLFFLTYTNTTNLMLVDSRFILFYGDSSKNKVVKEFIDQIFSKQKTFMLNKYAKREPYLPLEKLMNQIIWLKDRGIITDAEFDELKNDVFPTSSNGNTIGFTFNSSAN